MYTRRFYTPNGLLWFSIKNHWWLVLWAVAAVLLHENTGVSKVNIPWLPISLVGTAVAFYVGFKNNSAYGRVWEARKIWGGIVNSSRSWGNMVVNLIDARNGDNHISDEEVKLAKSKLIHNHINWLYTLRSQLLAPRTWERVNGTLTKKNASSFIKKIEQNFKEEDHEAKLRSRDNGELDDFANKATQIIRKQGEIISDINFNGGLNEFRHNQMQHELNIFYNLQGKCERIKNFPCTLR